MKPNKKLLLITAAIAAFQSGLLFAQVDDEASLDSLISQFAQEDSEFCEMNIRDAERTALQLAHPYSSEVSTLSTLGQTALQTWHRNLTKNEGEGSFQHDSRVFDVQNLSSQINEANRTFRRKSQLELAIELEQQLRENNARTAQTQADAANAEIARTVQEKNQRIAQIDRDIQTLSANNIYASVAPRVQALEAELTQRQGFLASQGLMVSFSEAAAQGRGLNRYLTRVCNNITNANRREQTNLRNSCKAAIRFGANALPSYQQMSAAIAPTQNQINALNQEKASIQAEIQALGERVAANTASVETVRNAPADQRVAIASRRLPVYASRIRSIQNSVYTTLGLSVERGPNGQIRRSSYLPGSYLARLNTLSSTSCSSNDRVIYHNGRRQILNDSIQVPNPPPAGVTISNRNCAPNSAASDYEITLDVTEGRVGICQKMSVTRSPVQGVTGYKLCSTISITDLGIENTTPAVTHQVKWFGAAGIIDVVDHNLDTSCRLYRRGRQLDGPVAAELAPATAPAAQEAAAPAASSAAE